MTLSYSFRELMAKRRIEKFNPYHDALGRFTTGTGATSFTIRTKDQSKQSMVGRSIIKEAERTFHGMEHERAVATDKHGNVVFSANGDQNSVNIPEDVRPKLSGSVFTHNHPSNSIFSDADIATFVGLGIQEIRAVGSVDSFFSLKQGDGYTFDKGYEFYQGFVRTFNQAARNAQRKLTNMGYAEEIRAGRISQMQANTELNNIIVATVDSWAKANAGDYGLIYESDIGSGYHENESIGKSLPNHGDIVLDKDLDDFLRETFNGWLKEHGLNIEKYNHNHDPATGRFTTGSGASDGASVAVPKGVNITDDDRRMFAGKTFDEFQDGPDLDDYFSDKKSGQEHPLSRYHDERGHLDPDRIEQAWYYTNLSESAKGAHKIGISEADDIIGDNIRDSVLEGWFRSADSDYKPQIENATITNAEMRNAALNVAHENYNYFREANGQDPVDFDTWLNTPITVYRGEHGQQHVDSDVFTAYSYDRKIAEKFGDDIEERTVRPIDTLGSYRLTGECEIMVPSRDFGISKTVESLQKYNHNHDEKGRFASGSGGSDLKARQFEIIQRTNPAPNDYQTWVRSTSDILTLGEALKQGVEDGECDEGDDFTPDFSWSDAEVAIQSGKITVYSSHDIESGAWVTPSKMEAESYGGANSKEVPIEDIAWVDPLQGMYAPTGIKKYNHNHDPHTGRFTTGDGSSSSDAAYMEAAKHGDIEACRKMLEQKARALASDGTYAKETSTYKLREGAEPQKTIKVYKTFYVDENGQPSALFVEGTSPLPVGVWMDAKDAYHFTNPANGKEYTPSRVNPNAEDGKGATGSSVKIPNEEVRQELIDRGFLKEGSTAQKVTALAYRPGWHAGDLPFFPQGGKQDAVYAADESAYAQLWKDIAAEEHVGETKAKRLREERYGTFEQWRDPIIALEHPYKNLHEARQVVFECELIADTDYTRSGPAKKDPTQVQFYDMQEMPKDGSYKFATNPMANSQDLGAWYIGNSLRIVRPLSQRECDDMLRANGRQPQAWTTGEMNLEKLGVNKADSLDLIVYDSDGKIIPLSERFKKPVKKSLTPTGCGVIVVNGRGEVLIGTRKENASKGQICGPGGHIEHGETAEEAAIREAREEFNIECRNLKRLGTQNGGRHGVSAVFLCTDYSGTPRTDEEEMTNCRWADPEDLEEDLFPPFERSLELLRVKKFNRNHDPKTGRFTSGVSRKLTVVTSGGYKDYKGSPFGDATTGEEDVPKIDRDKPKEDARRMLEGDEIVRYGGKPTRGHVKLDENWHDLNDFERFELAKNQISEELGCSQEDAQRYANSVKSFTGQGGAFVEIRAYQRGELDGVRAKMIGPTAKALDEYIENAPQWDGGSIYRGISSDERHFYAGLEKGDVIDMGGASSWTSERSVADEYSGSDGEIFVVDKPTKGTSVSHLSHYPHEGEVAVSSTVSYRVTSVEYDENGVKITHLVQCKLPVTKSKSFFGVLMDKVAKYNHNHDPATGRFTSGSVLGTSGGSGSGGQSGQSKACILEDVVKGEPMDHNKADSGNVNPNFDPNSTAFDYRTNCYLCVLAYEARRRGYNVEAEANMGLLPTLSQSQTNAWKNPDGSPVKIDYTVDIEANDANPADTCYNNLMINMKNEGRYHFSFAWGDGRGAHVVCLSKPNGVMEIYDPQSDETIRGMNDCKEYLKRIKYPVGNTRLRKPSIVRVDNKEFSIGNVMTESYIFREKQ